VAIGVAAHIGDHDVEIAVLVGVEPDAARVEDRVRTERACVRRTGTQRARRPGRQVNATFPPLERRSWNGRVFEARLPGARPRRKN
jgi:hypothetical protein